MYFDWQFIIEELISMNYQMLPNRLQRRRRIIVVISLIIVVTVAGELIARTFMAPDYILLRYSAPPFDVFLHPPYGYVEIDERGLYNGAGTVVFRTSGNRFTEPEPTTSPVLFLGGSTTENLNIPENTRWPAILGGYNGSNSGATILDELRVFKYFTERGFRFSLVVLMTPTNDFAWFRRLKKLDYETWPDDVNGWYWRDPSNALFVNSRTVYLFVRRFTKKLSVAESYAVQRREQERLRVVSIDECPNLDADIDGYYKAESANMKLFRDAVVSTGATLLVMSEATSYLAPSESFVLDFRPTLQCENGTRLSNEAQAIVLERVNSAYLNAAVGAGLATIDLASIMNVYTNGDSGGKYMYDSIHYTDVGSLKVAEELEPLLNQHVQVVRRE